MQNERVTTHNLKVVGSNPTPATKNTRDNKDLKASQTGGFLRSNTPGSTAEARGREVLGNKTKSRSSHARHVNFAFRHAHESRCVMEVAPTDVEGLLKPQAPLQLDNGPSAFIWEMSRLHRAHGT
jgi:hypothetical protein